MALRIGESYSALTWSGDVAGGVNDMVATRATPGRSRRRPNSAKKSSTSTSGPGPRHGSPRRLRRLGSLTSPADRRRRRCQTVDSLTELVTRVYGPTGPLTEEHVVARNAFRAAGVRELLLHYGFTRPQNLNSQSVPVERWRSRSDLLDHLVHGEGSEGSFDTRFRRSRGPGAPADRRREAGTRSVSER